MDWDIHLKPNAFGLFIANNPYHWELCLEPEIMRGGDSGAALHSGAGRFAAWLTLATSFYRKPIAKHIQRGYSQARFRFLYSL